MSAGDEVRRLPEMLSEHFASVKFFGRVHGIELFGEEEFGGRRARIEHDQPDLSRFRNDRGDDMRRIVSIRVF